MRKINNFNGQNHIYKVNTTLKNNNSIVNTDKKAENSILGGVSLEISHRGLAMAGELQEFEDTYEVRKSLCKGIGTKEIINGNFVDTLAENYKKQSDAIAEQYDGEEYDKQMKLLDKAFEDASDIVSSSYSRQMRVLTGDIVINRTVKNYSTREAAEEALSKNDTSSDRANISPEQGEKVAQDVKKICVAAKDSVLGKGMISIDQMLNMNSDTFSYMDLKKVGVFLLDKQHKSDLTGISEYGKKVISNYLKK